MHDEINVHSGIFFKNLKMCMEEKEKSSIFNAKKIKMTMIVDFPLYLSKFMFISYYLNMCSPKKFKKINKRAVPNKSVHAGKNPRKK